MTDQKPKLSEAQIEAAAKRQLQESGWGPSAPKPATSAKPPKRKLLPEELQADEFYKAKQAENASAAAAEAAREKRDNAIMDIAQGAGVSREIAEQALSAVHTNIRSKGSKSADEIEAQAIDAGAKAGDLENINLVGALLLKNPSGRDSIIRHAVRDELKQHGITLPKKGADEDALVQASKRVLEQKGHGR